MKQPRNAVFFDTIITVPRSGHLLEYLIADLPFFVAVGGIEDPINSLRRATVLHDHQTGRVAKWRRRQQDSVQMLKMVALAPIPKARVRTAHVRNPGLRRRVRMAYAAS